MIFFNPSGAPELACDECGCRWFDRMHDCCYECGAAVPAEAMQEFERALKTWGQSKVLEGNRGQSKTSGQIPPPLEE